MGARKKSKGKIPGSPPPEPLCEQEQLSRQLQGDMQLLDLLLSVGVSPKAAAVAEQVQGRLQETCIRQQELLQSAAAKINELTQENQKLREKNTRLQHKLDSANYELRRALGIRTKAKKDAPEAPEKKDPNEQGAAADSESDKKKKGKKRGAPKEIPRGARLLDGLVVLD